MDVSRTGNAKRNIIYGIVNKGIALGLPFAIRTIIIYKLGVQYLGLGSLFSSILQVLNMAELGFSSAITYNLYKPMAESDTDRICALLALYRKIYQYIGIGIISFGIVLMPLLPELINGEYPSDINIYTLYLIYLFNTSISYLFFAYKNVLLTASQRQDILSNIDSSLVLIKSLIQIILLLIKPNYYTYILWNPVITLINNIIVAYITNKKFPDYICKGTLKEDEINSIMKLVKGSAIGKVAMVARNSLDSIVLSLFLGLIEVAKYSNYYFILNAVGGMASTIIQSVTASVGNSIATESVEKNYQDFKKFNFYYNWLISWCSICMLCLYQPFMELWVGKDLCTGMATVCLFCIYFYVGQMGQIRAMYATAAGIWWEFRKLFIGEAIGNFLLNFLFGYLWGMNGIIFATIITVFSFSVVGLGLKTVRVYFNRSAREYFLKSLIYFIVTVIAALLTYFICIMIKGKNNLIFFVRLGICCMIPNLIFMGLSFVNIEHRLYIKKFVYMAKTKVGR